MTKIINCDNYKMEFRLIYGNCSNCPFEINIQELYLYNFKQNLSYNRLSRKEFIEKLKSNIEYGISENNDY